MNAEHEQRLAEAFVALADTLVDDFDILDFLGTLAERAADLLSVSAAGVVLSDQRGGLATTAASSERARVLELVAVQTDDGPCRDCLRTGAVVTSSDLSAERDRWPRFASAAEQHGYRAATAVPMRLRDHVIGALTLLNAEAEGVDDTSTQLGQALADVATISILQQRAVDRTEILSEQLQATLNNNVTVAQARGVLAEHGDISLPEAHSLLRRHARQHGRRLSELAHDVAVGDVHATAVLVASSAPSRQHAEAAQPAVQYDAHPE
ncbi:GAF and ANTAR domain-containing protein [Saccharopolyspora gloriosae]|uniref:GAF and ANTAR domain-containing protein n=1 Tax=Saccharopolyspora gloriosae TaxID=455344 RepID=UPI001FB61E91|nr:GAF and ANTAR domain-containing protein [Saccharopolyspora gloriosae]